MSLEVLRQLLERYGDEVCTTVISENSAIAESPSKNMDVFSFSASSIGAKNYAALYAELQQQGFL
jgi:chromosome partitioning protein